MYFVYLISLLFDFKTIELKKYRIGILSSLFVFGALYLVLFVSAVCFKFGNYEEAYSIVPFYTEALQEELYTTTNEEIQLRMANKIYPLNKNVSGMCEALSNEAKKNKKYDTAWEHEKKRLELNKYKIENYMYYLEFLSEVWQYNLRLGKDDEAGKYAEEILNIENDRKSLL